MSKIYEDLVGGRGAAANLTVRTGHPPEPSSFPTARLSIGETERKRMLRMLEITYDQFCGLDDKLRH